MIDAAILQYISNERQRQIDKWGEQHLPDGTGKSGDDAMAQYAKYQCDRAHVAGDLTWRDVLNEEFREALAESEPELLKTELKQVAAVCVAWIRDIESRQQ